MMRALALATALVLAPVGLSAQALPDSATLDSLRGEVARLRASAAAADSQAAAMLALVERLFPPPPPVPPTPPEPPPVDPRRHVVPAAIAADCSVDVTAALHTWIASVPDSSTLVFAPGACYNTDAGLKVYDRWGLTFEGNGAEFRRVSRGITQQSNFAFQGGGGLTLRHMTITGANPAAGTGTAAYVAEVENQHGVLLASIQGALLDSLTITDVYGDFVAMTHDYRLTAAQFPGIPNRDITIRRGHFDRNGRMGIAVTHGERIAIEDSYIGHVRWSSIDVELDDARQLGRDLRIERNRFGPMLHQLFVSKGAGTSEAVGRVVIRGNVQEAPFMLTCLPAIAVEPPRANLPTWSGWIIEGNTFRPRRNGLAIDLTRLADVTIQGNTIINGTAGGCGAPAPIVLRAVRAAVVTGTTVLGALAGGWATAFVADAASSGVTATANRIVP